MQAGDDLYGQASLFTQLHDAADGRGRDVGHGDDHQLGICLEGEAWQVFVGTEHGVTMDNRFVFAGVVVEEAHDAKAHGGVRGDLLGDHHPRGARAHQQRTLAFAPKLGGGALFGQVAALNEQAPREAHAHRKRPSRQRGCAKRRG